MIKNLSIESMLKTDHEKMLAEFYDDKFYILQPSLAQGKKQIYTSHESTSL